MTLAAIVLAAGSATRFGADKLAAPFRGEPLVRHAIRAARAAPVARVILVCPPGFEASQWLGAHEWPAGPDVIPAPLRSMALSASLQAGIAAAGTIDGAFVFLGDMPLVPHDVAPRLAARLTDRFAAIPRHDGAWGHPVLLSARAFPAVAKLRGDEGAGRILRQRNDLAFLDVESDAILIDVDRPQDLARIAARNP